MSTVHRGGAATARPRWRGRGNGRGGCLSTAWAMSKTGQARSPARGRSPAPPTSSRSDLFLCTDAARQSRTASAPPPRRAATLSHACIGVVCSVKVHHDRVDELSLHQHRVLHDLSHVRPVRHGPPARWRRLLPDVAEARLGWPTASSARSELDSHVRKANLGWRGVMVLNDGLRFTPISKTTLYAGQVQLPGPELQVCTKVDLVRDLRVHRLFCVGLGLPGRLVPHPGTQGHVDG